MSADHVQLITQLYTAFQARDAARMAACYHADSAFDDPVFVGLRGKQVASMWAMLCERGTDLAITFANVQADVTIGSADWDARYTFSRSKRPVHNRIHAQFRFRDGLIIAHHDTFDFHRWAGQALGLTGTLLGWLPPFQSAVQKQSRAALDSYVTKRAGGEIGA
jgi:ketosteroid isomerase-like protein